MFTVRVFAGGALIGEIIHTPVYGLSAAGTERQPGDWLPVQTDGLLIFKAAAFTGGNSEHKEFIVFQAGITVQMLKLHIGGQSHRQFRGKSKLIAEIQSVALILYIQGSGVNQCAVDCRVDGADISLFIAVVHIFRVARPAAAGVGIAGGQSRPQADICINIGKMQRLGFQVKITGLCMQVSQRPLRNNIILSADPAQPGRHDIAEIRAGIAPAELQRVIVIKIPGIFYQPGFRFCRCIGNFITLAVNAGHKRHIRVIGFVGCLQNTDIAVRHFIIIVFAVAFTGKIVSPVTVGISQ